MKTFQQLIFCSRPSVDLSQEDLLDIMVSAQEKNSSKQISGLLIFHNNKFFQLIEGAAEEVDSLFAKIKHDERHMGIETLLYQSSPSRVMPTWVMGFSSDMPLGEEMSDQAFFVPMDELVMICATLPDSVRKIFCRFLLI